MRVFGRCLALNEPKLELRAGGQAVPLALREASLWMLSAELPAGSYLFRSICELSSKRTTCPAPLLGAPIPP